MKHEMIRIGIDFDGVVAYNPFRVIRAPISFIKKRFFGSHRLSFFVPKNWWQTAIWILLHESSVFPAPGADLLRTLGAHPTVELYLITGRYGFLHPHLSSWLMRNHLHHVFRGIYINVDNRQPHVHKEDMIKKLKLDYYIEDNLDIVLYVSTRVKAKVLWIYNILDRGKQYPYRYPYLGRALAAIITEKQITV